MRRRALLSWAGSSWGLAIAGSFAGCEGCGPKETGAPPSAPASLGPGAWRERDFAADADWPEPGRVVVSPCPGAPLLVALHGAGENVRGLLAGSRGWRDDYALPRAERRLHAPPLTREDFESLVEPARLAAVNESLASAPYEGLAVACPFTPRVQTLEGAKRWASFLERTLLPRAKKDAGLLANAKVGIDGVSMGGRLALLVGLARPDLFDSVGALQPALSVDEAGYFAELIANSARTQPRPLRLVTSEGDPFRDAIRALSDGLTRRGLEHRLLVTPGPHDYAWNRGPGSLEMLLWHDRVLRGREAV